MNSSTNKATVEEAALPRFGILRDAAMDSPSLEGFRI